MLLARLDTPFEHPDWIFEPKLDGFRALAYVEGGSYRLVSRNRNAFKTFEPLAQAIGQELSGRDPSWTARSCAPGRRPMMRRRGAPDSARNVRRGFASELPVQRNQAGNR
jgi:hypothetical protein